MHFYKLLAANFKHNSFCYKEGLNVDPIPFNPNGSCESGGLYYTAKEWIGKWYHPAWPLIADVTLPDDALVYPEPCGTKWKADRIVISNIRPLKDFLATLDEDTLLSLFKFSNTNWSFVELLPKTPSLCLALVQFCPSSIEALEQTPELCMIAVTGNANLLRVVKQQTQEICDRAVQRSPSAFEYVLPQFQTHEMCLKVLAVLPSYLRYVAVQTAEICLTAVLGSGCAIRYVREPTPEILAAGCPSCKEAYMQ